MLGDEEQDLAPVLQRMSEQAAETEERCVEVASDLNGKKTAILDKARETKDEASEMMETYLAGEDEALDGFEFLTMAEAGEVGHWEILEKLNERESVGAIAELVEWALPIQREHLRLVRESSLQIAGREDPAEPAG
jgi:hypothetical protein